MSLLYVLLVLAVLGAVTWIITTYVPMPPAIRQIIIAIAAIFLLLFALHALGLLRLGAVRVT